MMQVVRDCLQTNPSAYMANNVNEVFLTCRSHTGGPLEKKKDIDKLSCILIYIGKEYGRDQKKILRLLNILFSEKAGAEEKKCILEEDFNIKMTKEVESEAFNGIAGLIREYMQKKGCSAEETMNTFLIP